MADGSTAGNRGNPRVGGTKITEKNVRNADSLALHAEGAHCRKVISRHIGHLRSVRPLLLPVAGEGRGMDRETWLVVIVAAFCLALIVWSSPTIP